MTHTDPTAARQAIYSELMWPEWNPVSESHGTGDAKANELLNAFEAEVRTAVVSPLPSRAAVRKAAAEALREHWEMHANDADLADQFDCCADAVLAVLPAQDDRAAVLEEAATIAEGLRQFEPVTGARSGAQVSENVGILRVAAELRRLAVEAQNAATAEHHTVDGIRYLCHTDDHYCPSEARPAEVQQQPTDEDILVAVDEALEGALLPNPGVGALESARDAVLGALRPLVDQLRQTAVGAQQEPDTEAEPADTLPAWLLQRFDPRSPDWEQLSDDDRAYWEHQARAVRRAVARGGFKAPVEEPALVAQQPARSWTARLLDAVTHSGPGYDLTPSTTEQQPAAADEETGVVPCGLAILKRHHGIHRWEPQPGMTPVRCPGHS
ncbi:hypothetical protein [Streptomyces griseofuscus]|uniref:hypothetical protein n=1 Tax=Streptomyces griseofuscus TaxID=146922 RepID=UPI0036A66DB4